MIKDIFKDLKWHILLLLVSIFFICKFSSAPPLFDALNMFFLKPEENTFWHELFRILENLSLAYIASLIFYLLVDYIPLKKEEKQTLALLDDNLCSIYMYMDEVVSYFNYHFGLNNFKEATNEEIKKIDDFYFENSPEFLVVKSTRDGKDGGEHVDSYDAKKATILCGKNIKNCIHKIDEILNTNKAPLELIVAINKIRACGFLEKMIEIMPISDPIINGQIVPKRYVNFYRDLIEFSEYKNKLEHYKFTKLKTKFIKASDKEIQEWIKYQLAIKKEHPEIEQIYAQLNNL